ncbi:RNA polymerase II elongation factor ELL2-like [Cynocephalus volans]|uniref:RNA polymerase II elongation factor ELL2-like n=1 Tax=Cynocephalus volans TaxID=110931 RepID=UPI002FC88082
MRYNHLAASRGRTVGKVVHQERDMAVEKPNITGLGQYNVTNFNFQLSNMSKGNHQDTVDDIQQTVSSCSPSQLSCLHMIQDKKIVCGTNGSYEMTQGRMAQAEEKSCNKWEKYRKRYVEKRVPVRRAPKAISDPVPERKKTAPINPAYTIRKSRVASSLNMRPYRDRVIHLLALKDYRKHELFIRLWKDGIPKNAEDSLAQILDKVADLNTKNFSYTLKDHLYKEIQKDWPGYNDLERQVLELILLRKADPFHNADATNHPEFSIDSSLLSPSAAKANPISPSSRATHFPISNSPLPVNSNCHFCSNLKRSGTQYPYVDNFSQNSSILESHQSKHTPLEMLASISTQTEYPKLTERELLMSDDEVKYTFREHKANSQKYYVEMMEKEKTDPKSQDEDAKPNCSKRVKNVCTASGNTHSPSVLLDYLTNYFTIVSSEQRQQYEQEFRADYDEYRAMYSKMLMLSSIFLRLGSERKQFSPESKEYQDISKKILLEYQKMKQNNPTYDAEKYRCIYLYNKLVHIKKLINDFDQQQKQS